MVERAPPKIFAKSFPLLTHRGTEIGMVASRGGEDDYVTAIVGGRCRQSCEHHNPRTGNDYSGACRTSREYIKKSHPSLFLIAVMIPTVSILMITHTIEVIVWALSYWIVGAAPPGSNLVDFAFVNFTTLGYGDVVPVKR